MRKILSGVAIAALFSTSLSAQTAPVQTASVQESGATAGAREALILPVGTEVLLAMSTEINSTANRAGDTFALTVVSDVRVNGVVVIPRGTRAMGEITWRTGKGAFGKSGKMDIAMRYIDLDGVRIPVEGTYRQEGEGNTLATVGGVILVGVFAGFITGSRARVPVGRELLSRIGHPIPFTADGRVSPSYDQGAAVAAAAANSREGRCRATAAAQGGSNAGRVRRLERECMRGRG